MATEVLARPAVSGAVLPSPWARERRFFGRMTVALAIVMSIGFSFSTYIRTRPGSTLFGGPTLLPLVRAHATVSAAWMLMLIGQAWLIASRRTPLHRKLGVLGGVLAVALVVMGWIVAFDLRPMPTTRATTLVPAPDDLEFLILPLEELVVFTALIGAALFLRRNAAVHKRLMVLGTLALIPASTTRPPALPGSLHMNLAMFGLPEAIFIGALAWHDLRSRGRLHPATLFGGGLVLVGAMTRSGLSHTDAFVWLMKVVG